MEGIGRTAPADGADGGARRVLGDTLGICRTPLEDGVKKIETKTDEWGHYLTFFILKEKSRKNRKIILAKFSQSIKQQISDFSGKYLYEWLRTIEKFNVDDEFNWEFLKGVLVSAGENNAALQNNQDII